MSKVIIGLVVEGKTDYNVLRPFITQTLVDKGLPLSDIEFKEIQPSMDATSMQHKQGGWPLIRQWCLANPPNDRDSIYFEPLFAGEDPCDLIVVQMDGDVIDCYSAHVKNTPLPAKPWDAAKRGAFVEAALSEWLWPAASASPYKDKHILAISVQAIEAWLLAGYDHSLADPEEVDPVPLLIAKKSGIRKMKKGQVTLRKSERKWAQMARETLEHLPHIRSKCSYCDKFLAQVETAV